MESNAVTLLNNPEVQLTNDELMEKADIKANWEDFYFPKFVFKQSLYSEASFEQKEEFLNTIQKHYYSWLQLNDEIVERDDTILNTLSEFVRDTEVVNYVSDLAEEVFNAFKAKGKGYCDPQAGEIMRSNTQFIKEFDDARESKISHIKEKRPRKTSCNEEELKLLALQKSV